MADPFPITITPGRQRTDGDAHCVVVHDDVQIWEVDFDTKYAEIFYIEGDNAVVLESVERTLRSDPDATTDTRIEWDVPENQGWHLQAQFNRYTLYAFLYRRHVHTPDEIHDNG